MDKLFKIKLRGQLRQIKTSTMQCSYALRLLRKKYDFSDDPEIKKNLENVIQHQKNMYDLFQKLEQQLY